MAKFIATVFAIVIGIIITRQIIVWIFTFKKYAESVLDIDPDQSEDDWEKFKQLLVSSTLGTLITIFIILVLTTTPILPDLE